ncbi:MAG: 4Fe-4S dicluster domain-containing protein [Deltaproteobacteria bacterium]|nr:4Fe-4S dicluster domain-containing protein [Deltaproteobacteria bacterium]
MFIPDHARVKVVHDALEGWSRPTICLQCEEPMCLKVCPVEAISHTHTAAGDHVVLVDQDKCVACQRCVAACPFGAMDFFKKSLATKCDLCGGDPMCVQFCFYDCLHFEELSEEQEGKRRKRMEGLYRKACKDIGQRELYQRREAISLDVAKKTRLDG